MRQFVGAGHIDLLQRLVGEWSHLRRPRMITLAGFPGYGKSRLVQELYREVAARQTEPAYWPAEIPVSGDELTARRKRLAPGSFIVPSGAEPEFVWLSIEGRIESDTGLPAFALGATAFAQQIEDHVMAVLAVAERTSGAGRQVARELGRALVSLGGFIPLLSPLATAIGVSDTFGALRKAVRSVKEVRTGTTREREVGRIDATSALSGAVAGLTAISEVLPIVLVVEDAHDLDEVTVQFLHDLLESGRGRILVVATAWPDRLGAAFPIGSFGRLASFTSWTAIDRWDVQAMSSDELTGFVLAEAPGTSPLVVDALVNRCGGNPLLLEGLLRLRVVARSLNSATHAFELNPDDSALRSLPSSVAALYARLWEELPESVRDVLMVASAEGALFTAEWCVELAEELLGSDSSRASHELARDTYSWVRALDERVEQFVEVALLEAASSGALTSLSDAERASLRAAIVSRTLDDRGNERWKARSEESRAALLRHVVNASEEGLLGDTDILDCRIELASYEADHYRFQSAIALVMSPLSDQQHRGLLLARYDLACWLHETGRVDDAIEQLTQLLTDQTRILGPEDPNTLETRRVLANSLGQSGRLNDAIEQLTQLLTDQTRILGHESPDTLETRYDIAVSLLESGRLVDATHHFTQLLPDETRILGPHHPTTLTSRGMLADSLGRSGRINDAIEQLKLVLGDQSRVLGPDHPETLTTRNNLAFWLGEGGHTDEAIGLYRQLLADKTRVLGPDHPSSLTTRANLISLLGDDGRINEAIHEISELLIHRTRILGPDHPDTLLSRGMLADSLGRSGRINDAIEQLKLVLANKTRVLGPDHPQTFTTRNNLAYWLGEGGYLTEAIEQSRQLVADETRVLGPDHPQTFISRFNLAARLGENDEIGEAVRIFSQLLIDRTRILGPDHPDTLDTQWFLQFLLNRPEQLDS